MPISAEQWRAGVGLNNAARSSLTRHQRPAGDHVDQNMSVLISLWMWLALKSKFMYTVWLQLGQASSRNSSRERSAWEGIGGVLAIINNSERHEYWGGAEYRMAIRPWCGCGRGMCPPCCPDHEVIYSSSKNSMKIHQNSFCVQ